MSSRLTWATEWELVSKTQNHHHKKLSQWSEDKWVTEPLYLFLFLMWQYWLNFLMLFINFFFFQTGSHAIQGCLELDMNLTSAGITGIGTTLSLWSAGDLTLGFVRTMQVSTVSTGTISLVQTTHLFKCHNGMGIWALCVGTHTAMGFPLKL